MSLLCEREYYSPCFRRAAISLSRREDSDAGSCSAIMINVVVAVALRYCMSVIRVSAAIVTRSCVFGRKWLYAVQRVAQSTAPAPGFGQSVVPRPRQAPFLPSRPRSRRCWDRRWDDGLAAAERTVFVRPGSDSVTCLFSLRTSVTFLST